MDIWYQLDNASEDLIYDLLWLTMVWSFVCPYLEACVALNTEKFIFILVFHIILWLYFGGCDIHNYDRMLAVGAGLKAV